MGDNLRFLSLQANGLIKIDGTGLIHSGYKTS